MRQGHDEIDENEREKSENECGRDEPERQRANKHLSLRGTTMTCLPVVTMLRSLWRCVNLSYCPWFGNTESGRSVRSSEVRQIRARPVHPSSTRHILSEQHQSRLRPTPCLKLQFRVILQRRPQLVWVGTIPKKGEIPPLSVNLPIHIKQKTVQYSNGKRYT